MQLVTQSIIDAPFLGKSTVRNRILRSKFHPPVGGGVTLVNQSSRLRRSDLKCSFRIKAISFYEDVKRDVPKAIRCVLPCEYHASLSATPKLCTLASFFAASGQRTRCP